MIHGPRIFRRGRWRRGQYGFPAPRRAALLHRLGSAKQALVGPHSAWRALAIADAALASYLNLQDFFARRIVLDDGDIAVLEVFGLIRSQAGIGQEQHKIMYLLGIPFVVVMEGLTRIFPRRLVELLVLRRAEPGSMHDLALRPIGRRQVGQVSQPAMTDCGFEHLPQGNDLIVDGRASRGLASAGGRGSMHTILLHLARCDLVQFLIAEEGQEMQAQPYLVALHPARAALAFGDDGVFLGELVRRFLEGAVAFYEASTVLAAQRHIPVLGEFLGQGQAVHLAADPAFLALEEGIAMPVIALTAPVEMHFAAQDGVILVGHEPVRR